MAFVQDDVKRLIAYSSVSHLGFCMLGLFALTSAGVEGSIFAMLSHGLTTSGLFLAIGVLYERRHTRKMADFGGLFAPMPIFGAMFLICVLGSAGLPGLSGFVGEFLTIFGTFIAGDHFTGGGSTFPAAYPDYLPVPGVLAGVAATGVILGAVYLLYMFQKVMFGPITHEKNKKLRDLSRRELLVFLPVIALIFVMGLFPRPFLKVTEKSVDRFISDYQAALAEPEVPEARVRGFVPPDQQPAPAARDAAAGDPAAGDAAAREAAAREAAAREAAARRAAAGDRPAGAPADGDAAGDGQGNR